MKNSIIAIVLMSMFACDGKSEKQADVGSTEVNASTTETTQGSDVANTSNTSTNTNQKATQKTEAVNASTSSANANANDNETKETKSE